MCVLYHNAAMHTNGLIKIIMEWPLFTISTITKRAKRYLTHISHCGCNVTKKHIHTHTHTRDKDNKKTLILVETNIK